MTAETGNDAESSKKRGRIPQSAWPSIVERYRTGATLSAIAREYECTPSAISYIIRKAEAAGMDGEPAAADDDAQPTAAQPTVSPAESAAPAETAAPVEAPRPAAPAPVSAPVQQTLRLNAQPRDSAPEPPAPPPSPVAAAPAPVSAPAASPATAPAAGARPEPTPPLDAVEARLRETARGCLSAYRSWRQTPGEASIQSLSEAVHELRKALARVEIDMSASRRDEQAIRPIPIPAHRAARRPQ